MGKIFRKMAGTKTQEQETDCENEELDVSWYPTTIEELHELLTFYRKQMMIFKHERTECENKLNSQTMSNEQKHGFEWKLHQQTETNAELTKQLSDTHILLYNEKNSVIQMRAQIKTLTAQCNALQNEKAHLLQILEAANGESNDLNNASRRHKNCKACHQKPEKIKNAQSKLTTVYLPNDSAQSLQEILNAKKEEIGKMREQSLKISEFLMSDRNKAQQALLDLRAETNEKFKQMQAEMAELSKQNLFNIKEYLAYRRQTKQTMHDLELAFIKQTDENNKIKKRYADKAERIETSQTKLAKDLKKESKQIVNGFRMENMQKHKELSNVRQELASMSKSYHFDMNSLKEKLVATKRKNKKLNRINKCQREGMQTDVDAMKKRLDKLQKTMNGISFNAANGSDHASLQNEINKIQKALMDLGKISRAED